MANHSIKIGSATSPQLVVSLLNHYFTRRGVEGYFSNINDSIIVEFTSRDLLIDFIALNQDSYDDFVRVAFKTSLNEVITKLDPGVEMDTLSDQLLMVCFFRSN